MNQMHSSGEHLLCFTFHSLGRETVKQRLGARFNHFAAHSYASNATGLKLKFKT